MFASILYIILALLGISFLIFIHELGHYFMARKLGITVEVFSIGFGKSLCEWNHKGVKWKLGWLPFGGYVKMAGMEKQGVLEPHQIESGFFSQKPWNQIKVSVMGPLVNILFAFLAFSFLWMIGGRDKPFSEFTHYIGWVDSDSNPYKSGIRPGDEITKINQKPMKNFEDILYTSIFDKQALTISGYEINYDTQAKNPFTYTFSQSNKLKDLEKALNVMGTINPAQYAIYDKIPKKAQHEFLPDSPLFNSGIANGDRILWVDGELIFSQKQFMEILNNPTVLLTVQREGKTFLTRVPRLQIKDLRLTSAEKAEFDDWKSEAGLKAKIDDLFFIPYNLNAGATVEAILGYVDEHSESQTAFEMPARSLIEIPLQKGDKIIAVHGQKISKAYDFLKEVQTRKSLLVVKNIETNKPLKWTDADKEFINSFEIDHLHQIARSIGTNAPVVQSGSLHLLKPVTPLPFSDIPATPEQSKVREEQLEKYKKAVEEISDPKQKEEAEKEFHFYQNRLMLGLPLRDKLVSYNPSPFVLFGDVFKQIYKTLFALFAGSVSPKNLSGPIGIVYIIQHGWSEGAKEALYWLGMISFNLGILNLLPIPVLDGGYIIFALVEWITKKPIKMKTRERLILPFYVLLIAFFIYVTYHDIARLFGRFF